jgi:site-specific recombinase XerD
MRDIRGQGDLVEPTDTQLPATIQPAEVDLPAPNVVPTIIADLGNQAGWRYVEFFTANIRNPHTRRAYACNQFFAWCDQRGLTLSAIRPHDVAIYIEQLQAVEASAPSVKQQLAAVRMLSDWLVVGQVMPPNPASAVRGPRHVQAKNISDSDVFISAMVVEFFKGLLPRDVLKDDQALVVNQPYSFSDKN